MRCFLLSLSLLLLSAVPAQAFTNLGLARYVASAVAEGEVFIGLDRRKDMATGILTYWDNLDQRLPRLSPDEQTWMTGELQSENAARIARVVESREYHLHQAGLVLDYCLEATNRLVESYLSEETAPLEMLNWTDVADCYHRSHDRLTPLLEAADLVVDRRAGDGSTLDGDILTTILTIVVPSAMADTMGWTMNPG